MRAVHIVRSGCIKLQIQWHQCDMLILKNKTRHYYIALFRFTNECHITNSNSQFSTSFCLLAAFNKGDQPSFLYQFPFLQLTLSWFSSFLTSCSFQLPLALMTPKLVALVQTFPLKSKLLHTSASSS